MDTAAPPGVYVLGPEMVMPLPDVRLPWQEEQVPSPGAPECPNGGLVPNEYMIAGTDMSDTIVVANIAVLRLFVPNWIAPLRNIKDSSLFQIDF
jgi:hypothetical protein